MAKAIPPIVRARIIELCQKGKTVQQVSQELGLGYPGVAKVWRMFRKHGPSALELGYHRCGRKSPYSSGVRQEIDKMLSENSKLGAPIIRSRLLAKGSEPVPHERTIQRWWRASGKNKPRSRRPVPNRSYDRQVHGTWQIDAKENVRISDSSAHSYLSITDEASCTFLMGHVFPPEPTDETGER